MSQIRQYVDLFKALSDETRLRLIILLSKRELCVCEIEAALGISQTKASRHLAILRRTGLLKSRRDGSWIYYSLKEPIGNVEETLFGNLRGSLQGELSIMEEQAKQGVCTANRTAPPSDISRTHLKQRRRYNDKI